MEISFEPRRQKHFQAMCQHIHQERYTVFGAYRIEQLIPLAFYVGLRESQRLTNLDQAIEITRQKYLQDSIASGKSFRDNMLSDGFRYAKCLDKPGPAIFELGKYFAGIEIKYPLYRASWLKSVDDCSAELRKLIKNEPSASHQERVVGPHGGVIAVECCYHSLLHWLSGCLATGVQATGARRREEISGSRLDWTKAARLYAPPSLPADFVLVIKVSSWMARELKEAAKSNHLEALRRLVGNNAWAGMEYSIKAQDGHPERCIEVLLAEEQDCDVELTIGDYAGRCLLDQVYSGP